MTTELNIEDGANPGKLDQATIDSLKKAGFSKPTSVSWGEWAGPKKLSHRHELVAMMAAAGKPAGEIAKEFKYTDSRMSIILNTPRMQKAITRLRTELFGESVHARFNKMMPKAVDVIESILDDKQEKSSVRLKAANELLNRSIGKPKETVEIKTSSVRDIFDYLDQMRNERESQNAIAFDSNLDQLKVPTTKPDVIDAEAILVSTTEVDRTEIDLWITANVPSGEGIGTKKGDTR